MSRPVRASGGFNGIAWVTPSTFTVTWRTVHTPLCWHTEASNTNVPFCVAVPENTPSAVRVRPGGTVPLMKVYVA